VLDRWRQESEERSRDLATRRPITHQPPASDAALRDLPDLEERFDGLRVAMSTELGRRIDAALARMEGTFEREIEALRTSNREEAKRLRSSNGEGFVQIRAANTQELERIRRAVDEGIERLCSVLEGQLDRVWGANDVELERIRSVGADRLAEVHDLLTHQLGRLRMEQAPEPTPEPPPPSRRRWARRSRGQATG
jgi:DNA anti-recombination protein RmuC